MKKAVITSGGKQYLVAQGDTLEVDLLLTDKKEIEFQPLMLIDGDKIELGRPLIEDKKVEAKVVQKEVKADKVTAIRYKAKKRVHKTRGHRQIKSQIEVTKI